MHKFVLNNVYVILHRIKRQRLDNGINIKIYNRYKYHDTEVVNGDFNLYTADDSPWIISDIFGAFNMVLFINHINGRQGH